MKISGYMYKFQNLTPISGHLRTNFKISGISGQRPGLSHDTYGTFHGIVAPRCTSDLGDTAITTFGIMILTEYRDIAGYHTTLPRR